MSTTPKAPRMQIDQSAAAPETTVFKDEPTIEGAASTQGASAEGQAEASASQGQQRYQAYPTPGAPPSPDGQARQGGTPRQTITDWVHRTFPGHEHAFWGAVIGLLFAVLVFAIGIWRALFIVLVVGIGITIGQFFDGDPRIVDIAQRIFGDRN